MARFASYGRPPILASTCLLALVIALAPPRFAEMTLEPLGPAPKVVVQGERNGAMYTPPYNIDPHILIVPPAVDPHILVAEPSPFVDRMLSGLKRLIAAEPS